MNVTILGDRLMVEPIAAEKETKSGLIIPEGVAERAEKSRKGVVACVGEEITNIKVGETVLYSKYSGTEVKVNDKDYVILRKTDIYAII
jgi:chaperonin GroES